MDDESRRELGRIADQLERQDKKLDEMQLAIVALARVEERLVTLFNRTDAYALEQKELMKRVAELERVSIGRGMFFRSIDKAAWLVIGGAVTLGIGYLQAL